MNTSHLIRSLLLAAVVMASPIKGHAAGAPTVVDITKFAYSPKELTVVPGTTVRWTNHDETPHTVTSQAPSTVLKSKAMDTDDTFEFTFRDEGDFNYYCTVHPFMTAVVHVKKR
jgi:plastocyanin